MMSCKDKDIPDWERLALVSFLVSPRHDTGQPRRPDDQTARRTRDGGTLGTRHSDAVTMGRLWRHVAVATAGMIASEFLDQDVTLKHAFSAEISVVQEPSSNHRDRGG